MVVLTETMIEAACVAARQSIENYSSFDSAMVPDDALRSVVVDALKAAVAVLNTKPKGS